MIHSIFLTSIRKLNKKFYRNLINILLLLFFLGSKYVKKVSLFNLESASTEKTNSIQAMEKYIIILSQPNCVGSMAASQIERALRDKSIYFFGELLGKYFFSPLQRRFF